MKIIRSRGAKKKKIDDVIEEWKKINFKKADNKKTILSFLKKEDEFYTSYEDIEKEMEHWVEKFKDKIIYLPCDDVYQLKKWFSDPNDFASKFWVYFHKNFTRFKLKKLIATYKSLDGSNAKVFEYEGGDDDNVLDMKTTELNNDGDFRNLDNFKFFQEADLIITNPPFSLFRAFYKIVKASGKDFIFLGGLLSFSTNELIMEVADAKVFYGFTAPEYFFDFRAGEKQEVTKLKKNAKTFWYTSFNNGLIQDILRKDPEELKKYKWHYVDSETVHISEMKYLKEVDSFHKGVIMIPVTGIFKIDYLNEWEILGVNEFNKLNKKYEVRVNGKEVFKRLLIRRRNVEK